MTRVQWDDSRIYFELPELADDDALKRLVVRCTELQKNAAQPYFHEKYKPYASAAQEVSEQKISEILASGKDVHGISEQRELSNVIVFNAAHIGDAVHSPEVLDLRRQIDARILAKMRTLFGMKKGLDVIESGHFWYPPGGYMGWHTNSKAPGWRLYVSYTEQPGRSFFRYRDPENGRIVTSRDTGVNFRLFRVSADRLLWHAVYSETNRFSLGYLPRLENPRWWKRIFGV